MGIRQQQNSNTSWLHATHFDRALADGVDRIRRAKAAASIKELDEDIEDVSTHQRQLQAIVGDVQRHSELERTMATLVAMAEGALKAEQAAAQQVRQAQTHALQIRRTCQCLRGVVSSWAGCQSRICHEGNAAGLASITLRHDGGVCVWPQ